MTEIRSKSGSNKKMGEGPAEIVLDREIEIAFIGIAEFRL